MDGLKISHFLSQIFQRNAEQGFLIDQSTLVGKPFSVVVQDCTVEDVNLATGFANDGGSLTIESLTVATSNIVGALIAVNGVSGVLTVSGFSVFECAVAVSLKLKTPVSKRGSAHPPQFVFLTYTRMLS